SRERVGDGGGQVLVDADSAPAQVVRDPADPWHQERALPVPAEVDGQESGCQDTHRVHAAAELFGGGLVHHHAVDARTGQFVPAVAQVVGEVVVAGAVPVPFPVDPARRGGRPGRIAVGAQEMVGVGAHLGQPV